MGAELAVVDIRCDAQPDGLQRRYAIMLCNAGDFYVDCLSEGMPASVIEKSNR